MSRETAGRFAGRTALITGGARGIGYAAAERLAAEGAKLVLVDINGEAADAAAAALPDAIGIRCNISEAADVAAMVAAARQRQGEIDIFVNSAAVLDDKLFLESGPDDWNRMLQVCLHGPMLGL